MPIYKDEKAGTWFVKCYYTDYTGTKKQKFKRGFKRQKEAKEWERSFLEKQQGTPDMTFQTLYDLYSEDLKMRAKESTCRSQLSLIRNHILPYWGKRKINDITAADVRKWQTEMQQTALAPYTQYIVNCYLSSIFNFAMRFYNLPSNPCRMVKTIGKVSKSLDFWTLDEFKLFIATVEDPILKAAFLTLFYAGVRCGELLALTVKDFNTTDKTLTVCGTFHRFNRTDTITEPKTDNSNRCITIPDFLVAEIQGIIQKIYKPDPDDRIFQSVTPARLYTAIEKGSAATGIKRIRVHDIRHSHVSLLINMDFPPILIAERIGDTVEMVNRIYGHLYPSRHREVADQLEKLIF